MKNALSFLVVMTLFSVSGSAQLPEGTVIGSHAGLHSWEKCPVSLELKENHVYEIRSYDAQLIERGVIRGRWKIEGEQVLLTDLLGNETILHRNGTEYFMTTRNGVSCIARFALNKSVSRYWAEVKKAGC